jgi:hypothetical protein
MNSFLPEPADTGRDGKELILKPNIPTRRMREHPDLEQLKRQAKELLDAFLSGEVAAADKVHAHYRGADAAKFARHDAQLVIARSYGFESWPKLKAYVDGVTVRRLADAIRAHDMAQVRSMLKVRPELADMQMSYWRRAPSDPLRRLRTVDRVGAVADAARRERESGHSPTSRCHDSLDARPGTRLSGDRGCHRGGRTMPSRPETRRGFAHDTRRGSY